MVDVFISYKREERAEARAIAEAIASKGYNVWWDIDLLPGDKFAHEIRAVIQKAKTALVLWSAKSVSSDFVQAEARVALQRGILIPISLDDAEVPLPFNNLHTLDLREWDRTSGDPKLKPLIDAIARQTAREPVEIADRSKIDRVLQGPFVEVDYWKTISQTNPQDSEEYKAYLKRFGEDAQFADIARIRIGKLGRERAKKWPKIASVIAAATSIVALAAGVVGLAQQFGLFEKNEPAAQVSKGPPPPTGGNSSARLPKCNELTNVAIEGVSGRPSALEFWPRCGDELPYSDRYTLKVRHKGAVRASFYYHANSVWQAGRAFNVSGPGTIEGDYVTIHIPYTRASTPHDQIFWYAELTNDAGQTSTPQMQFIVTGAGAKH
jgi:hypothetical protein